MGIKVGEKSLRELAKEMFAHNRHGLILRAFMRLMMREINILRSLHALPARTNAQLRTDIINKIDSGEAD